MRHYIVALLASSAMFYYPMAVRGEVTMDDGTVVGPKHAAPLAKPAPAAVAGYEVKAIRAFLVYTDGKIDSRDLTTEKLVLWNTIIGEGSAGKPSRSTLVKVTVAGQSVGSMDPGVLAIRVVEPAETRERVEYSAESEKPNVLWRKSVKERLVTTQRFQLYRFSISNERVREIQIPVLVQDTGCARLEITARIELPKQKGKPVQLKATVPFACGE